MSLLEFYSKLYADGQCEETELDIDKNETGNDEGDQKCRCGRDEKFQSSRKKELQAAIDGHQKGKAGDSNGIRAEDIKTCDEETKEMARQIFNEVPKQEECTLEAWRRIRIKVIYKKGDVEAGNYRPICTLPALYILFSTRLYNRLHSRLDRGQPADQGGFRRSYQTLDHLIPYKMLEQRCREWGVKMWIATVDFAKALDTMRHEARWPAE